MADSNNTLELLIKLGYVGQDQAEAARTALSQTERQATDASVATRKFAVEESTATENAEGLKDATEVLTKILSSLGFDVAPEVGTALAAAFDGPLGILAALGTAVEYVIDKFNEAAEAARKAGEASVSVQAAALQTQADIMSDYAGHVQRISDLQRQERDDSHGDLGIIREKVAAEEQILDTKEKIALANAAGDNVKQSRIRDDFEHQKAQVAQRGEEAQVISREVDVRVLEGRRSQLQSGVEKAYNTLLQANSPDSAADKKTIEGFAAEAQKELAKANEELAAAMKWSSGPLADVQKQQTEARAKQEKAAERVRQYAGELAELDRAPREAEKAYEKAKSDQTANEEALQNAREETNKATERLKLHQQTASGIAAIEKFGPSGAVENTMGNAMQAIVDAQQGRLASQDKKALADFQQLMSLAGLNADQVAATLSKYGGALNKSTQQISFLNQEIALIHARLDSHNLGG